MEIMKIDENEITMTLKEVVDILNEERKRGDQGYIKHATAMKKVEQLALEDGFNVVQTTDIAIPMPNNATKKITTYILNKKQCLAVSASLNSRALMAVINRVEELEQKQMRPITPMMMIAQMAMQLDAQQRINDNVNKRLEHIELNTVTQETHFTASAFTNLAKIKATKKQLNSLGRRAAKLSRDNNVVINKVKHEKYGEVNSYKEDMLELAASQIGLI